MNAAELERILLEKGSSYWLTRFVILRLLGLLYAVAFLVAANQILPLIGSDGLLPVGGFLARVREMLGSTSAGLVRLPSIFWFNHSDAALLSTAWIGVALSAVVVAGLCECDPAHAALGALHVLRARRPGVVPRTSRRLAAGDGSRRSALAQHPARRGLVA